DILLYALGKPSFVIDNYTRRIFHRLGLVPEKGSYSTYRSFFMDSLPAGPELFGEYHALIVRHGKEVCNKRPACEGCCLLEVCPTGKEMRERS
ncbi:MAG: endonuclease, partial [Chloroflexi bacterium]|nr:endonuclease [Chloroflexota bacterium]